MSRFRLFTSNQTPEPPLGLSPLGMPLSQAALYSRPETALKIQGAHGDIPGEGFNLVDPAEGLRRLPQELGQHPLFRQLHTVDGDFDLHRPLNRNQRLRVLEFFTGVSYLKDPPSGVAHDRLSPKAIQKGLGFFGDEAFSGWGGNYLARVGARGWSSQFLAHESQALPIDFDTDDTLVQNWHVAEINRRRALQAFHHFVMRDLVSRGLSRLSQRQVPPTWGEYSYMTQMRPLPFQLMRLLRHDQRLRLVTDGDRQGLFKLCQNFPTFKAAVTGLLPYQKMDWNSFKNNEESIFTTRDHAKKIELLLEILKQEAATNSGSVFRQCSQEYKTIIALLLYGHRAGLKPYKLKIPGLRFLQADGSFLQGARMMVGNNPHNFIGGALTGQQGFALVLDRPPGLLAQIPFYGSTTLYAGRPWEAQATLNRYPALSYGDEPMLDTLEIAHRLDRPPVVDLNSIAQSQGVSGLRLQRGFSLRPYSDFRAGIDQNKRQAKQAIKALKDWFKSQGDLAAIEKYFEQQLAPFIDRMS